MFDILVFQFDGLKSGVEQVQSKNLCDNEAEEEQERNNTTKEPENIRPVGNGKDLKFCLAELEIEKEAKELFEREIIQRLGRGSGMRERGRHIIL